MRIMHFLNHTRPFNGHVNVAVDLACIQSRMGHTVSVVSGGGAFDELFETYGVQHFIVDQSRTLPNMFRAMRKFHRVVSIFSPEIVHAHMMTSAGLAFMLRFFSGFKLVTTVHNEFERSAILMGLGDRVVAVSEAVAVSMERRGVCKRKLRVVLNGTIHSPRLSSVVPQKERLSHPAITFVGGLHPRKGVDDLIRAFRTVCDSFSNATLYLLGAGPYEQSYSALAAELKLSERVQFCGCLSDPRPYLLGSDLFVLASHAEPAGLVLTEAREAGCAIVATQVGGIPEMLDGGKAGLLVPPRRPDLLAGAIISLLQDQQMLAEMRRRSRINLEKFTIHRASKEYLSIYESALARIATDVGVP